MHQVDREKAAYWWLGVKTMVSDLLDFIISLGLLPSLTLSLFLF